MFKEQTLETGVEGDKPIQDPKELQKTKKAKQEEERYKKEMEKLQEEERKKMEEKRTEEERIYAEQKAKEEEKQRKREEALEKILNLNFDDDDDASIGDVEALEDMLSESESFEGEDEGGSVFSYNDYD